MRSEKRARRRGKEKREGEEGRRRGKEEREGEEGRRRGKEKREKREERSTAVAFELSVFIGNQLNMVLLTHTSKWYTFLCG